MSERLAVPRNLVASLGGIVAFCGQALGDVLNGRVLAFFGEVMRQAGILITNPRRRTQDLSAARGSDPRDNPRLFDQRSRTAGRL